jgi:transposase
MMGRRQDGEVQFLYAFDLDKVVPPDHLVRQIDGFLDLSWVHKELAPYYSHTGRPSIDPVLTIRMLLVGYVFAHRSERRLCAEVQVNLTYRWFCRLGIEDKIPDHSVFCRARRERFRESDALRRVFERVVAMCITAELVGGEAFSIDASLIKAEGQEKAGSGRIHFADSAHSWVSRCFPRPSVSSTSPPMPCHRRAGSQPVAVRSALRSAAFSSFPNLSLGGEHL